MNKLIIIFLLSSLPAYAATPSDLVGKWVSVKMPSTRAEITENGGSFIVTKITANAAVKLVGKLSDGVLTIMAMSLPTLKSLPATSLSVEESLGL
jgi:hypothetical protein